MSEESGVVLLIYTGHTYSICTCGYIEESPPPV